MTVTTTQTLALGAGYEIINTLGYNIDLLSSTIGRIDRQPRGSVVPRKPGIAVRRTPQVEPSEIELSIWVSTRTADGIDGGQTQLWTNLDLILPLLTPSAVLVPLRKIRESASGLLTLDTTAEISGPLDIEQRGTPEAVQVLVPMRMPYPYWEAAQSNQASAAASWSVSNAGHADCDKVQVRFEANTAWTDPELTNDDLGWSLKYTGTIGAGDTYVIDLWAGTAVDHLAASITGAVDMSNGVFPTLRPGANAMSVADGGGDGTVRVLFDPPYIG